MKRREIVAAVLIVLFGLGVFSIQGIQGVQAEGGTRVIGETCVVDGDCAGKGSTCHPDKYCYFSLGEGPQGVGEILKIMGSIGNFLFGIFMGIALLFIVWGGIQFVVSGGDPTKVSEAKKRMIWAVVGVGIALLAAFVDDVLRSLLSIA